MLIGRQWWPDGCAWGGRQVQVVWRHLMGNWVCGEEPTWSLHKNFKVQRVDQSNFAILKSELKIHNGIYEL